MRFKHGGKSMSNTLKIKTGGSDVLKQFPQNIYSKK